jgi:hypothetical protein
MAATEQSGEIPSAVRPSPKNDRPQAMSVEVELAALDAKISALLPPKYQSCLDAVSPTSMGSAGLKYGSDSRVAWDEIWTHFCDLALAGGPPHRGTLLEAPTAEEVAAEPAGYQLVYEEIVRGIRLTTGLECAPADEPGWVTVQCQSAEMAAWLLRAIMAENVFVRRTQAALNLPAGPQFRIAKEVKNVVVSVAKTWHYWNSHLSESEQAAAALALTSEAASASLLEPPTRAAALARADEYLATTATLARILQQATGLPTVTSQTLGWVKVRLRNEMTAAWYVRAAIAEGILARRETDVLCLPAPAPRSGEDRFEVVERLLELQRLWVARAGKGSLELPEIT